MIRLKVVHQHSHYDGDRVDDMGMSNRICLVLWNVFSVYNMGIVSVIVWCLVVEVHLRSRNGRSCIGVGFCRQRVR
jgi:hypothetical protein